MQEDWSNTPIPKWYEPEAETDDTGSHGDMTDKVTDLNLRGERHGYSAEVVEQACMSGCNPEVLHIPEGQRTKEIHMTGQGPETVKVCNGLPDHLCQDQSKHRAAHMMYRTQSSLRNTCPAEGSTE